MADPIFTTAYSHNKATPSFLYIQKSGAWQPASPNDFTRSVSGGSFIFDDEDIIAAQNSGNQHLENLYNYIRSGDLNTLDAANQTLLEDIRGFLQTGIVNTSSTPEIQKVDQQGAQSVVISGFDANGGQIDAFGRLRVSEPLTLFDSKSMYGKIDLLWDEEFSNGETVFTGSSINLNVSGANSYAIRQTKMRFNYQPAKSHSILFTYDFEGTGNAVKRVGYYNSHTGAPYNENLDGIFLEMSGERASWVIAKDGEENRIFQSEWNFDKFDGTGPSQVNIDHERAQLAFIDMEWLGVGTVRCGYIIDGQFRAAHLFNHSNIIQYPYILSPNRSMRYEIRGLNSETNTLRQICCSVRSEGGMNDNGILYGRDTDISSSVRVEDDVFVPLIGLRLKEDRLNTTILLQSLTVLALNYNDVVYRVEMNPTIIGPWGWSPNGEYSAVEIGTGDNVNFPSQTSISGNNGHVVYAGYFSAESDYDTKRLRNAINLGCKINGERDTVVISVKCRVNTNDDMHAAINWLELV